MQNKVIEQEKKLEKVVATITTTSLTAEKEKAERAFEPRSRSSNDNRLGQEHQGVAQEGEGV